MLSGRLPRDRSPNLWARLLEERRAAGAELVDLTEANPTRVGLGGVDREAMVALASAAAERYEPDARGAPRARAAVADYYAARGAHDGPPVAHRRRRPEEQQSGESPNRTPEDS